ncbi:PfkB family carbohydrate kinase [Phycicoccus elongatus]|jgi:ribokinase|uniref:PfkB family carbohydrate kinase n=1 Tax=Phycicoccus elongatus TaxID=101689 RepID=UPI002BFE3523|nr:PfkB family carbohydrate kinase [Phycicoccus elongatus]HOA67378.1 PfkB family carbohydrate kinase [Phycicoccus elongatus]HPF77278.1 PfkB family carbohydrate kinase [Phycicoccus elongatus]
MGRVLVLGSLNVDLVTSVERHPRPGETVLGDGLSRLAGGKGANQAVAARAAGVEVTMVGCVGADAGGAAYRKRLAGRGIDVAHVRTVSGEPTGTALIAVSDDAENAIIVVPGANAALDDREVEAVESLTVGDVLLLQLEVPLPVVCRAARRAAARGVRVVINIAPYAALPADVIALADPVIANEHEAVALAESGAVPGSLLVTYGANGTSWNGRTWSAHSVPRHQVLDTTGAGDAFCGALAAALALGHDESHAMDAALAAGAAAVRRVGAQADPEL